MPELPEVETVVQSLGNELRKKRLLKVWLPEPLSRKIDPSLGKISHQRLEEVSRVGKYLLFHFEDAIMLAHLGMSGKLLFVPSTQSMPKHTHVAFFFENPSVLAFVDPRRFGRISLVSSFELKRIIPHGIEPLSGSFSKETLFTKMQKSSLSIKAFLMSQQHILGIGNIYASEVLFKAKILPTQTAFSVDKMSAKHLHESIVDVLTQAVQNGGTSLSASGYKNAHSLPGNHQHFLQVYGREGQNCKICKTSIQKILQHQRSTYFCPHCQK